MSTTASILRSEQNAISDVGYTILFGGLGIGASAVCIWAAGMFRPHWRTLFCAGSAVVSALLTTAGVTTLTIAPHVDTTKNYSFSLGPATTYITAPQIATMSSGAATLVKPAEIRIVWAFVWTIGR